MRVLRLLLLTLSAALLTGQEPPPENEPLAAKDFLLRLPVQLPATGDWVRIDLPPVVHAYLTTGFDDLRIVDAEGKEVDRLVLPDVGFFEGQTTELSVYRRDPLDEGRARVGLVLPGPGDAPTHLRLSGALDALNPRPIAVSASIRPGESPMALDVGEPVEDGRDLVVELPPFVGRLLSVEGPSVKTIVAEWRPPRGPGGDPIEPKVVDSRPLRDGMVYMLDLRTRFAPGLRLTLELAGPVTGNVLVSDAGSPESVAWRPIAFDRDPAAPEGRIRGVATVPGGKASRWISVRVPSDDPADVTLESVSATIRRHRVYLRREGLVGPLTMLGGLRDLGEPPGELKRAAASWDAGTPGFLELIPRWAPALGPGNLPVAKRPERAEGSSTPWAAIVFTILAFLLLVLTLVAGAPPDEVLGEKS